MYERKEYFLCEEFVPRRGWTVMDIGAYVGIFSLYASKAVGNEGLVLSFEPSWKIYCRQQILDKFLEENKQYVGKPIDLVKIDVEGYELKVLKGVEKALQKRFIKRLVIEVHVDQVSTETIIRYLEKHGFHIAGIKHFGWVKDIIYANLKEPK